jgi:DivIVA domain-containing protein
VALDRQSIEKRDFPIGRRGYDPDAVDTHLAAVAAEMDDLRRHSRERSSNLAAIASEQVRSIVEAAEQSGAEIARQAETDAREIREGADAEARASREEATEQARDYVGKVAEASTELLGRVDAMESELGQLVETLRTGANRLNADLQLLQGNLAEVSDATGAGRRFEPEVGSEPATDATATVDGSIPEPPEALGERLGDEPEAVRDEPEAIDAEAETDEDLEPVPADGSGGDDDAEGARLVALNMALNGSSRDETDQYLSEHFTLADRAGLLDEVYATVEG